MILDAVLGHDPGATAALVIAALTAPELALVTTVDEWPDDRRARLARTILDLCGRRDVPVVAGALLAEQGRGWSAHGLIDPHVGDPRRDVAAAVAQVCAAADGMVRWVGLGPMSNLAAVAAGLPEQARRLAVVQMVGARPDRVEHNIGRDLSAARRALTAVDVPWLVLPSDTGHTPGLELVPDEGVACWLAHPNAPRWARLLAGHLTSWVAASGRRGASLGASVTLSVAMGLGMVQLRAGRIGLDAAGRMVPDPQGVQVMHSTAAVDHGQIMAWVTRVVTTAAQQVMARG